MSCPQLMIPKLPESFTTIRTNAVFINDFSHFYKKGDMVEIVLVNIENKICQLTIFPIIEQKRSGIYPTLSYVFTFPIIQGHIITLLDTELARILYDS